MVLSANASSAGFSSSSSDSYHWSGWGESYTLLLCVQIVSVCLLCALPCVCTEIETLRPHICSSFSSPHYSLESRGSSRGSDCISASIKRRNGICNTFSSVMWCISEWSWIFSEKWCRGGLDLIHRNLIGFWKVGCDIVGYYYFLWPHGLCYISRKETLFKRYSMMRWIIIFFLDLDDL